MAITVESMALCRRFLALFQDHCARPEPRQLPQPNLRHAAVSASDRLRGYVTVNSSKLFGHLDFSLGLQGTWAFQPLDLQPTADRITRATQMHR